MDTAARNEGGKATDVAIDDLLLILLLVLLLAGSVRLYLSGLLLMHDETSVAIFPVPLETSEVGSVELIVSLRTID